MKLPLDNLNYPVRITLGRMSGSGFLIKYDKKIYLVTAKHVLYQQDVVTQAYSLLSSRINVMCYKYLDMSTPPAQTIFELNLETLSTSGHLKMHTNVDLVVIELGLTLDTEGKLAFSKGVTITLPAEGKLICFPFKSSRRFSEVEISNDVFVLGYPSSISTEEMKQIDFNSPLIRKGIVAGKNNSKKTLILDCPVYGGNSGGMVLEVNNTGLTTNFHLIGIVVEFVPFVDQWENLKFKGLINSNFQNSGYSVVLPIDYIYDLVSEIELK